MDRRAFLRRFGLGAAAAAAAMALDPEMALWVPGQTRIFLPAPKPTIVFPELRRGDIITIDGVFAVNPQTGKETEWLQQFVVIGERKDQEDPIGTVTLVPEIWPPIVNRNRRKDMRGMRPLNLGDRVGVKA